MSILAPSARLVGNRISRKEDPRLLTGRGRYVDDVVVPGMLHVAFARSDIARGRIVGVDVAAAREADGVVAVLTAADLNHLIVGPWVRPRCCRWGRSVRTRCWPTTKCATSAIPTRWWWRRAARSPRTHSN